MLLPEASRRWSPSIDISSVFHLFMEITEIEHYITGCLRWSRVQGEQVSTAWTIRKAERRFGL